jgi:hypothetical protein
MQRTSTLCGSSALPHLRALAFSRAPRALCAVARVNLKVSDEFTVPLCAIHHHQIHTTGKEREWWQRRKIDAHKVAGGLWQQSREHYPAASETDLAEVLENKTDRRRGAGQASDDNSKSGLASPSKTDPTHSADRAE